MDRIEIEEAFFAEAVTVSSKDASRYINTSLERMRKFKMVLKDNMLWIYNKEENKIYATSFANLKLIVPKNHQEVIDDVLGGSISTGINKKIDDKTSSQVNKKPAIRSSK